MRDGIPSFFGGTREQHEQNRSGPGLRAPEYIPSPYDYRNNAPELQAHRALSLRWHSDRRTEQEQKEATEKMAEINQANDVLCNEVERRFYDRWGVLPNEE
ncbi:unnamed protein product [Alternaria alternata]